MAAPWLEQVVFSFLDLQYTTEGNKDTGRDRNSKRTHRVQNLELGIDDDTLRLLGPDGGGARARRRLGEGSFDAGGRSKEAARACLIWPWAAWRAQHRGDRSGVDTERLAAVVESDGAT